MIVEWVKKSLVSDVIGNKHLTVQKLVDRGSKALKNQASRFKFWNSLLNSNFGKWSHQNMETNFSQISICRSKSNSSIRSGNNLSTENLIPKSHIICGWPHQVHQRSADLIKVHDYSPYWPSTWEFSYQSQQVFHGCSQRAKFN